MTRSLELRSLTIPYAEIPRILRINNDPAVNISRNEPNLRHELGPLYPSVGATIHPLYLHALRDGRAPLLIHSHGSILAAAAVNKAYMTILVS